MNTDLLLKETVGLHRITGESLFLPANIPQHIASYFFQQKNKTKQKEKQLSFSLRYVQLLT